MNLHITYYNFLQKAGTIVSRSWRNYSVISLLLCFGLVTQAQTTINRTVACNCLDNNAPSGKAQFYEELTINSGLNETWYISSVSGFYDLSSPTPPAAQVPFSIGPLGDTLTDVGGGVYTLEGLHIEDLGYSIEITNGVETGTLSNVLCAFPSGEIDGDVGICDGETIVYSVVDFDPTFTYQWSITGQGSPVGSNTGSDFTVNWNDDGSGEELVQLYVEGDTGCSSTSSLSVDFEEDLTLACNNSIQITISSACIIEVSPDDILESMQYDDESYEITLTDLETGEIVPQGTLASDYLLDSLEISIEHLCSGNSCWGYVVFEDKYVPPLLCANDTIQCHEDDRPEVLGFPLPTSAVIYTQNNDTYLIENFDPCGDATLTYSDTEQALNCAQDFASIVTRTWTITDFSGSEGTCIEYIYKTRTTVEDVIFPLDYDDISKPALQCDGSYPKLPNGNPDPNYTGFPTGGICDHLTVSYTDLISEICGATYKVIRKWKVIDECAGTIVVNNQLIKIEDNDGPDFLCPSSQEFLIENQNACDATVSIPVPTNFTDCSGVSFSAVIVKLDDSGNIAGTITPMNQSAGEFTVNNRGIGEHRITITGLDECGFSKSCSYSIFVDDGTPPVAICDQSTTISLDNEGSALVPVSTFNNGSTDNCAIAKIEVSRGSNSCGAFTGFSDHIVLCCADANSEVMVTLKVTDLSGNVNTCMVVVVVQDKKAPVLSCPGSVTTSCDGLSDDLSIFGMATASDNCSVVIEEESDYQLNSCGVGTIYRIFTATDPTGNTTTCTQVINVTNTDPFLYGDIIWPADYTTSNCVSPELHPDDLPLIYSRPDIPSKACSNAVTDYDDQEFANSNGACKTIFRTWTVIDQCTNNSFEYIQKLYVNDSDKPVFEECSSKTLTGESQDDCNYAISYVKLATDACTLPEDLTYSYIIDVDNNGGADILGYSFHLIENLQAGTHKVIWTVIDPCGNQTTCMEFITIEDTKKPSPYCIGGISTVVMPSTGTIAVWANDFDLGSTDNCTDHDDLRFSFSENPLDTGAVFTCEHLEGLDEQFFTLEVYVHDEAGNFDFCTTTIRITATTACSQTGTITLGGVVNTEDDKKMQDVIIDLTDNTQSLTYQGFSDEDGVYAFQNLPMMMEYNMMPSYDGNAINGITTLDIILIQKHLLGLEILDSPYKIVAADINNSESISGADIVQLRKLILGYYDEFPNNTSWRFVAANQEFSDPFSPWPLNEHINILADTDYMSKDFVSIKIGDVNLSRSTGFQDEEIETRSNETVQLEYRFTKVGTDNVVEFTTVEALSIYGLQMGIQTELATDFQSISSDFLDGENSQVRVVESQNIVLCSFSGAFAQKVDSRLFSINFGPTSPQHIDLDKWMMHNEMYVDTERGVEAFKLDLRQKEDNDVETPGLQVFQNSPNPFTENTEIRFYLPQSGQVSLEIRNTEGILLVKEASYYEEGMNKFQITSSQLPNVKSGGVLIYSIITANERISNKMVAIK